MVDSPRDPSRLWWGVILLVAGLVFLLNNFGYFGWGRWWPLLLIAIGVAMLFSRSRAPEQTAPPVTGSPPAAGTPEAPVSQPARRGFPMGAVILIGIGLAFLLEDVIGGNAFPALVLIAIGIAFLLRGRWPR